MGGSSARSLDDYIAVDFNDEGIDASSEEVAGVQLHVARISNNQDLLDVKDALYAGDIAVASISPDSGLTEERIENKLAAVAKDVQGDIVRKDHGELVIVPAGINIPRERIGR
jgi:hypothetical protein